MSGKNTDDRKCTRERLFPVSDNSEGYVRSVNRMHDACKKLLENAIYVINKDISKHYCNKNVFINDIYVCLLSLYMSEKKGEERNTLTSALKSPKGLKYRFELWYRERENSYSHSPGAQKDADPLQAFDEDLGSVLRRRGYYRKRFQTVLRENKRIVEEVAGTFFTYGSRELPGLSLLIFREHVDEIASSFKPTLSDQDFWKGEEPIYKDGECTGKREGPSAVQLDQFCEQLFQHVATLFSCSYLISLDMVMDILPRCYTYFESKNFLAISSSSGDEDKVPGEIEESQIPGTRRWTQERDYLCSFVEKNSERIRTVVRSLDQKEALLLCCKFDVMPQTKICRVIGQKSSGRIQEKCVKAAQKLRTAIEKADLWLDMHRLCDSDEGASTLQKYYFEEILSVVRDEWREEMEHALQALDASQETKKWN